MSGTKNVIVWNEKIPDANIEKFKIFVNEKYNLNIDSYWDLHDWSLKSFEQFWEAIWSYFNVLSSQKYDKIFRKTGPEFFDNEWFVGAKFNYAENILRHRDDKTAITYLDEDGKSDKVTHKEMYEEVQLYAAAFRKLGLKKGDVVACYLSNRKEAVFAMLATISIGAIWGGTDPFAGSVLAKKLIGDLQPKFMITQDRFQWLEEEYNMLEKLEILADELPTIIKTIIVPTEEETLSYNISCINNSCFLHEFLDFGRLPNGAAPDMIFEQVSASHPIYIEFTSGTTGDPKGLVHSSRVLLSQLVETGLHFNLSEEDVFMNNTPFGWLVWNMSMISLAIGANVFLYNGSFSYILPNKENIWDIMSTYKVKVTFMVPNELEQLENKGILPKSNLDLAHFQLLFIGGSPVKRQNYEFLKYFEKKFLMGNAYGASEVLGLFTGFDMNLPAFALEAQVPGLNKDIQCLDENGISILDKVGNIVLTNSTPSLLSYILHDENNRYLKENYLTKYPGYFCQNDIGYINPETKGLYVTGRRDDLLSQNEYLFPANDIYSAIYGMEGIEDYICVSQRNKNGESRAVLFIKLKNDYTLSDEMELKIRQKIKNDTTPYYVPKVMLEVKDIPYNTNKKKLEILVSTIITTNKIPNVSKIKNPECLEYYINIPILMNYDM